MPSESWWRARTPRLPTTYTCLTSIQRIQRQARSGWVGGGDVLEPGEWDLNNPEHRDIYRGIAALFGVELPVNHACPARCDMRHAINAHFGAMGCPTTQRRFFYCSDCGWREVTGIALSTDPPHRTVSGRWICRSGGHRYSQCDGCRLYERDRYLEHYQGENYCTDCLEERQDDDPTEDDDDYDDDYDSDEHRFARTTRPMLCATCNTRAVHLNLTTEEYVCDHKARNLISAGQPVKVIGMLPELVTS